MGAIFLVFMLIVCLGSLPWDLSPEDPRATGAADRAGQTPRYNAGSPRAGRLPPTFWPTEPAVQRRINALVPEDAVASIAAAAHITSAEASSTTSGPVAHAMREASPVSQFPLRYLLGTDTLGRSLLYRCLTGGGISLLVGIAAAALSVIIGTIYGAVSGYAGGRTDAVMMRTVDVLYGLPYVLLVVLIAVAGDALVEEYTARTRQRRAWIADTALAESREEGRTANRSDVDAYLRANPSLLARLEGQAAERFPARQMSESTRRGIDLFTLLVAIGGVSWLTMARIVRAQVQSLKAQAFVESARAIGVGPVRLFVRHLLPNLSGPIIVYATLTVPQAILQESFLSFLGIGVKPPLPSWGNLAAGGLSELNPYESNWWLLLFPCVLLAATLVALNFVGEALRESLDPRRTAR